MVLGTKIRKPKSLRLTGKIGRSGRSGRSGRFRQSEKSMYGEDSVGGDTKSLVMSSMNTSSDPLERLNQTLTLLESHMKKQPQKRHSQKYHEVIISDEYNNNNNNNNHNSNHSCNNSHNSNSVVGDGNDDDDDDDGGGVDKKVVRMDGLEVYAVVGALTAATSLSTFDNFAGDWDAIYGTGDYLEIALSYIFLIFASIGTISGLHTVLVFSLVTMYGRTAIGISDNDEYETFLDTCSNQRFRAFKTFLFSIYSFAIQTSILIIQKSPHNLRIPIMITIFTFVILVYDDAEQVISAATVSIFQHRRLKHQSNVLRPSMQISSKNLMMTPSLPSSKPKIQPDNNSILEENSTIIRNNNINNNNKRKHEKKNRRKWNFSLNKECDNSSTSSTNRNHNQIHDDDDDDDDDEDEIMTHYGTMSSTSTRLMVTTNVGNRDITSATDVGGGRNATMRQTMPRFNSFFIKPNDTPISDRKSGSRQSILLVSNNNTTHE